MKDNIKLTKQQAIEGHRKMWNWIADEIERQKSKCYIPLLKQCYCYKNKITLIADCFCCEYNNNYIKCTKCPLDWIETSYCCSEEKSLYYRIVLSKSWKEQADLSRQIANLPEKEDVE